MKNTQAQDTAGLFPLPKSAAEFQLFVDRYYWRPDLFIKEVLNIEELDPYFQPQMLQAPCDHLRIVVAGGKGVGKSYILGGIALWWKTTRPESMVLMYAGSLKQVKESSFGKAHSLALGSKIRDWLEINAESIRLKGDSPIYSISIQAIGPSTENAAGRHARNMLVIADECETLELDQWRIVEGNATDPGAVIIASGNPTRLNVPFHKMFTEWADDWFKMQLDVNHCKFRSKESIAAALKQCNGDKDDPYYRATVLGLFPMQSLDSYIQLELLDQCRERVIRPEDYKSLPVIMGLDLAYVNKDNVGIVVRQGRKILHSELFLANKDTGRIIDRVVSLDKSYKFSRVVVDVTGGGIGFTDNLAPHLPRGVVIPVHFSGRSYDPTQYANKRHELWGNMRKRIRSGLDLSSMSQEHYARLREELAAVEVTLDGKGRETILGKDEIKERLGYSPDLADSLALSLSVDPRQESQRSLGQVWNETRSRGSWDG